MNIEKLKYSKCPYCKKHVMPVLKVASPMHCEYCGKTYKINKALLIVIQVGTPFMVGISANLFNTYVVSTPLEIWLVLGLILYFVFQYFVPLEEIKKK